jgi:F0F1-type ATP synthase assembly protein I
MLDKTILNQLFRASTVGLYFVFSTVVGGFMGYGLDYLMDRWFNVETYPWLLCIFTFFGIIAGYRELVRLAKKSGNESRKKNL